MSKININQLNAFVTSAAQSLVIERSDKACTLLNETAQFIKSGEVEKAIERLRNCYRVVRSIPAAFGTEKQTH